MNSDVQNQLTKSFSGAADIATQYPQHAARITAEAKDWFLAGADCAYTAGIIAILLGAVIAYFLFHTKDRELQLLDQYHAEDTTGSSPTRRPARSQPTLRHQARPGYLTR